MCLYGRMIKNRKYTKTKKNGGVVPSVPDRRVEYIPVGCSQCMECRKQKQREWLVRLLEEVKTNQTGKFITLTFSNEELTKIIETGTIKRKQCKISINTLKGYEKDNAIATYAIRHFLERWRKEYGKSLRHWLVTELGHKGTENIHIHGIIWNNWKSKWEDEHKIVAKIWKYGFIHAGKWNYDKLENYVNEETVGYITKYVSKIDKEHKAYKPIILCSSGIGNNYTNTYNSTLNQYKGHQTDETYRTSTGHKIALPIYYRNKIYTDDEKERLWINKLDTNTRYVNKEAIIVKTYEDQKKYEELRQYHRRINADLGYGTGLITEECKEYENRKREEMITKRTNHNKK